MTSSRRSAVAGLMAAAAVIAAAALLHGGGDVARAQYGGATPVYVNTYGCIALGGQRSVPAGSEIVIRQGYASTAAGGVNLFFGAQTTVLSVNDAQSST